MADTSTSIGIQRDLSVRLGNTLRPLVLTLRLKSGQLSGGKVSAAVFRSATDSAPVPTPSPAFVVTELEPNALGEPRYRLTLDKDKVAQLAKVASDQVAAGGGTQKRSGVRTLYWTCSYELDDKASYPLYYGKLIIYLGATGG